MISNAARELGKKGGAVKSEAKTKAAIENAKKPRGKLVTSIAYRGLTKDFRELFGVCIARGKLSGEAQFDEVCRKTKCWGWIECDVVSDTYRVV